MAFRKKAAFILQHNPDIVVVPECEHPDKLIFPKGTRLPTDILWFGTNIHKGLGVFSYSNYRFQLLDCHNPDFKTVLPIAVTGGDIDFTLFAIWANNPADKDGQYVEQVWKALHHYEHLLSDTNTVLAGDFNSNTIWDRPKRVGNHSAVVQKLAEKQIHSVYHTHFQQEQGKEVHPTLYLYRHLNKPYHLDYCFASADFLKKMKSVDIGAHKNWTQHSDHMPITVTFGF